MNAVNPKRFETIDDYFQLEDSVSVQTLELDHLLVTVLEEGPNDIAIAETKKNALLLSISGSDRHRVSIDDRRSERPTRPQDLALIPAGVELRSAWQTGSYRLRTLSLEFDSRLFAAVAPEVVTPRFAEGSLVPANYAPRPELAAMAMLLMREMTENRQMGRLYTDTVTRLLALEIAGTAWSVPSPMPIAIEHPDPRFDRAVDFIEANFRRDISLADIAAAAGLSIGPLTGQFRQRTGMSPYSFVIGRRLRQAVSMLRTTRAPIAVIAFECGFSDQAQLTRTMRTRIGHTPGAIRNGGGS